MDLRRLCWISLLLLTVVGCQVNGQETETPTPTVLPTTEPKPTAIPEVWKVLDLGVWPQVRATAVSYHPTQPIVAIVVSPNVYFYDTNSFALINQIESDTAVDAVRFSGDGEYVVLKHLEENQISRWQGSPSSFQFVETVDGEDAEILTASSSQDGTLALSTVLSDTVHHAQVWSVADGALLHTFAADEGGAWLSAGQLSADNILFGNVMVQDEVANVVIRPLPAPHLQQRWTLPVLPTVESWALSPNGRFLLSDLGEGQLGVWETTSGELLTQLPLQNTSAITHIVFADNGFWVAVAQAGGQVQWWALNADGLPQGEPLLLAGHRGKLEALHFAPDGTQLALVSAKGLLEFVNTAVPDQIVTIADYTTDTIQSLAFSEDGNRLAVGREDGQVHLWQVENQLRQQILPNHQGGVDSVAFAPSSQLLATGVGERVSDLSFDDTVRLWEDDTIAQQFGGEQEEVIGCSFFKNSVAFAPDGAVLAAGSHDFTIHLWDVASGEPLRKLAGHTDGVLDVTFSPDGALLASASLDGTVGIWQWRTGALLHRWPIPPSGLTAVSFSPAGSLLVVGALTGKLYLWDVAQGELLRTFDGEMNQMGDVIFVGNGRFVAAGANLTDLQLWDVTTGEIAHTVTGHTAELRAVAYFPEEKILLSGADDGLIHAWQLVVE